MPSLYHRLPRDHPAFAHWRLPVSGLIAVVGFVAGVVALIGVVLAVLQGLGQGSRVDAWMETAEISGLDDPIFLGIDLAVIALLLPVVVVALLATGPHQVGLLASVEGRVRWGWLGLTSVLAMVLMTGGLLVALVALPVDVVGARPGFSLPTGEVLAGLLVVLLLVPFQAAAEEVVFRGYLMQLIGSWTRRVALGAVLGAVVGTALFVLAHGYAFWGQVDVGLFAVACVVLTLRTGGLEAAIALHVANNVVLFAFDGFAVWPEVTTNDEGGPLMLVPTVVTALLFIALVEVAASRRNLVRTRHWPTPPPPAPRPVWYPTWTPVPVAAPPAGPRSIPGAPVPGVPPSPLVAPPVGPARGAAPEPAAAARELHPDTPPYPGRVPDGWGR